MPLPKPAPNESQDDFISRFMGNKKMKEEYPDEKQRVAVAMEQWKNKEFALETFQEQTVYDISNVEIFKVGTWNGEKVTEKDLDDLVSSFKAIGNRIKPFVKLGHNKEQNLLQKDGLPAAGWVTNLKRKGETLFADLKSVPKKIKDLIDRKAYGRKSAEIYWNLNEGGRNYRRVLKAVALLGADTPAVTSLDDFINLYNENDLNFEKVKNYDEYQEDIMSEVKDIPTVDYAFEMNKLENRIAEIQKENEDLKAEIAEKEYQKKYSEVENYLNNQIKDGKILPNQLHSYMALALNAEEKEYAYTENNKEQIIKGDGFSLIQDIINNNPTLVEFKEQTKNIQVEKKSFSNDDNLSENDILDKEIKEFMKKNDIKDYAQAYMEISRKRISEEVE